METQNGRSAFLRFSARSAFFRAAMAFSVQPPTIILCRLQENHFQTQVNTKSLKFNPF
jgi:hypothetical protein